MEPEKDTMGTVYDPAELPISVCRSNAGYYIGQSEPCGLPYSRLSGYYKTHDEAQALLLTGWPMRFCIENECLIEALTNANKIEFFGTVGGALLARLFSAAEKSPQ